MSTTESLQPLLQPARDMELLSQTLRLFTTPIGHRQTQQLQMPRLAQARESARPRRVTRDSKAAARVVDAGKCRPVTVALGQWLCDFVTRVSSRHDSLLAVTGDTHDIPSAKHGVRGNIAAEITESRGLDPLHEKGRTKSRRSELGRVLRHDLDGSQMDAGRDTFWATHL